MSESETHYRNSFISQTTVECLLYAAYEFLLYIFFIHLKISLKVFTILKYVSVYLSASLAYYGKTLIKYQGQYNSKTLEGVVVISCL